VGGAAGADLHEQSLKFATSLIAVSQDLSMNCAVRNSDRRLQEVARNSTFNGRHQQRTLKNPIKLAYECLSKVELENYLSL
jgi:hypothetical protein